MVVNVPCNEKDEELYLKKTKDGKIEIYLRHLLNEHSIEDIANMTVSCNYDDLWKSLESLK